MMPVRRPTPIESHRRRHTFRATVVSHTSHTTGMWWWKQTFPSLKVRFIDEDFAKFREILERETSDGEGHHMRPPLEQEVEVGYHSVDERNTFAIGEEVEVLFSTAGAIDQFFTRAQPFRWDGLQKKQQPVAA